MKQTTATKRISAVILALAMVLVSVFGDFTPIRQTVYAASASSYGTIAVEATPINWGPDVNDISVEEAMKRLGSPYGATPTNADNGTYDCAGFVYWVLRRGNPTSQSSGEFFTNAPKQPGGLQNASSASFMELATIGTFNGQHLKYNGKDVPVLICSTWQHYLDAINDKSLAGWCITYSSYPVAYDYDRGIVYNEFYNTNGTWKSGHPSISYGDAMAAGALKPGTIVCASDGNHTALIVDEIEVDNYVSTPTHVATYQKVVGDALYNLVKSKLVHLPAVQVYGHNSDWQGILNNITPKLTLSKDTNGLYQGGVELVEEPSGTYAPSKKNATQIAVGHQGNDVDGYVVGPYKTVKIESTQGRNVSVNTTYMVGRSNGAVGSDSQALSLIYFSPVNNHYAGLQLVKSDVSSDTTYPGGAVYALVDTESPTLNNAITSLASTAASQASSTAAITNFTTAATRITGVATHLLGFFTTNANSTPADLKLSGFNKVIELGANTTKKVRLVEIYPSEGYKRDSNVYEFTLKSEGTSDVLADAIKATTIDGSISIAIAGTSTDSTTEEHYLSVLSGNNTTQNLVLRGKESEDSKPYYARIGITKNKTKTNSHIAGAVYTIYGTEANAWAKTSALTTVTTTTGVAYSSALSLGNLKDSDPKTKTYYVRETTAPNGYELDDGVYIVNLTGTTNTSGDGTVINSVYYKKTQNSTQQALPNGGANATIYGYYNTTEVGATETKSHTVTKTFGTNGESTAVQSIEVKLQSGGADVTTDAYGNTLANSTVVLKADGAYTTGGAKISGTSAWSYKWSGLDSNKTYTAVETKVTYKDGKGTSHTVTGTGIATIFTSSTTAGSTSTGSSTTIKNEWKKYYATVGAVKTETNNYTRLQATFTAYSDEACTNANAIGTVTTSTSTDTINKFPVQTYTGYTLDSTAPEVTWYVKETTAPAGYEALTGYFEINLIAGSQTDGSDTTITGITYVDGNTRHDVPNTMLNNQDYIGRYNGTTFVACDTKSHTVTKTADAGITEVRVVLQDAAGNAITTDAAGNAIHGTVYLTDSGAYTATNKGGQHISTVAWTYKWEKLDSSKTYKAVETQVKYKDSNGTSHTATADSNPSIAQVFATTSEDGTTSTGSSTALGNSFKPYYFGGAVFKTDDIGHPITGVQFGVYSDANCRNLIKTVTAGTDGYAVYNEGEISSKDLKSDHTTLYFKEVANADGNVVVNGVTYKASTAVKAVDAYYTTARQADSVFKTNAPAVENIEYKDYSVVKQWDGAESDIEKVTVYLLYSVDGGVNFANVTSAMTAYGSIVLKADGAYTSDESAKIGNTAWGYTWKNLPKRQNGTEIIYTARESRIGTTDVKASAINSGNIANGTLIEYDLDTLPNTTIVKNTKYYWSAAVRKTDGSVAIEGARIGVYTDADCTNLYKILTTTSNGYGTLFNEPATWGSAERTFYFKEMDVNAQGLVKIGDTWYYGDTNPYAVTVTPYKMSGTHPANAAAVRNSAAVGVYYNKRNTIRNTPIPGLYGQFGILKVDDSNAVVPGLKFNVYDNAQLTGTPYEMVTGDNGTATVTVATLSQYFTGDAGWPEVDPATGNANTTKTFYVREDATSAANLHLIYKDTVYTVTITGNTNINNCQVDVTASSGTADVRTIGGIIHFVQENPKFTSATVTKSFASPFAEGVTTAVYAKIFREEANGDLTDVTTDIYGANIEQEVELLSKTNRTYTWENLPYYNGTEKAVYIAVETKIIATDAAGTQHTYTLGDNLDTYIDHTDTYTRTVNRSEITNDIRRIFGSLGIYKLDDEGNPVSAEFGIYNDADLNDEITTVRTDASTGLAAIFSSDVWPSWSVLDNEPAKTVYIKELKIKEDASDDTLVKYPYTIKAVITGVERSGILTADDIKAAEAACEVTFETLPLSAEDEAIAQANGFSSQLTTVSPQAAGHQAAKYVEVVNDTRVLYISKVDLTTNEEIAGATLRVYHADEQGNITDATPVDEWVSGEDGTDDATGKLKQHIIKGLTSGWYLLVEQLAPTDHGFTTAADIKFRIEDNRVVTSQVMKDDHTELVVTKADLINTDSEVAGATLKLIDNVGVTVIEWVTGTTTVTVDATYAANGLQAVALPNAQTGFTELWATYLPIGTYKLHEAIPATGYTTAEDITIAVQDKKGQHVRVDSTMLDAPTSIQITKTDADNGAAVIGANLAIYADDGTGNATGDALYAWTTDGSAHIIKYIPLGKYVLVEQTAPTEHGYVKAQDKAFEVIDTPDLQTVEMKDDHTEQQITKTDFVNSEDVDGAVLTLYEAVTDTNGNVLTDAETGKYQRGETYITWTVGDTTNPLVKVDGITGRTYIALEYIPVGKYILVETTTPDGYLTADEQVVTVLETGEIQTEDMIDYRVPEAGTTLIDAASLSKNVAYGDVITLTDTVSYKYLIPGISYRLDGVIMDASTEAPLTDKSGNPVTASTTFTPDNKEGGTVTLDFTVDTTTLEGKTLVAFEVISHAHAITGETIVDVRHEKLSDTQQTVYVPEIHTTATSAATGTHTAPAEGDITITDDVVYKNLIVGNHYEIQGTIYLTDTEQPLMVNGQPVTAKKEFTATQTEGTETLTFTFPAASLEGKTVVVFEDLYTNDVKIGTHSSLSDTSQQVKIPSIGTTAKDQDTNDHVASRKTAATLVDTVQYTNLKVGESYTLKACVMVRETESILTDAEGKEVRAEKTFIPETENGTVDITFVVDTTVLEGKTLVVFEDLWQNDVHLTSHTILSDEGQSIHVSELHTTAKGKETQDKTVPYSKTATVTDEVFYKGLIVGQSYKLECVLVNKETQAKITDSEGNVIKGTKEFVAETETGSVTVEITFDSTVLVGESVVCFESLYHNDILAGIHADINDSSQETRIVKIGTTATDAEGTHTATYGETVKLVDVVSFKNLIPETTTYTVKGVVMIRDTNEVLKDAQGNEVRAEKTFVPETADGTVEIEFTIDTTLLEGKTIVVFEELYKDSILLAHHTEISDEGQSIHVPGVHTTATDDETEDHIAQYGEEVSVTDRVDYTNLIPGQEYRVEGVLVLRSTGEPLKDAEGNEVRAEKTFTPEEADGYVDLTFVFDSTILGGESLVAFENIFIGETLVSHHASLEDSDQTVEVTDLHTTATDAKTGDKNISYGKEVEIIDAVSYHNLLIGKEYTVKGVLMNKETNEPLLDKDGNQITAEKTFTATEKNGTINLTFLVDSTLLEGQTIVAFEDLYHKGVKIGSHASLQDSDQTTYAPAITSEFVTTLTGEHTATYGEDVELKETVSIKNLVVGDTYDLITSLVVKSTGEILKNEDGDEVTALLQFTAEDKNATFEVPFTINTTLLGGEELVAVDYLYHKEVLVGSHDSLENLSQTIDVPDLHTTATDKATGEHTSKYGDKITITDEVKFTNLIADGREYTITGTIMIKETGEALKDADGNDVTKTVKFIPEDRNGSITVEFEVDTKDIPGKSLVVFEDCWQDTYHIWLHASLQDEDQTVEIPKAGRIYVMKKGVVPVGKVTNEDGTATLKYDYIYLPGVEFTVYKDADCTEEVTKIVTDGNEKAASELLQVGTYYIKETFAPEGYVKDDTVYEKTLEADAETDIVIDVTMDLVNRLASATLKVYKADPSKRPLKGVVYGLFANEEIKNILGDKLFDKDDLIITATSDADGIATFADTLPAGKYYFKELKTIPGYIIETSHHDFTLELGNDDIVVEVNKERPYINEEIPKPKEGIFKLYKTDEYGHKLTGAEFLLTCIDTGATYKMVVDENGYAEVTGLETGKVNDDGTYTWYRYKLEETKGADPIEWNGKTYTPQIKAEEWPHYFTFEGAKIVEDRSQTELTYTAKNWILGIEDMSMGIGITSLLLAMFCFIMCFKKKKAVAERVNK